MRFIREKTRVITLAVVLIGIPFAGLPENTYPFSASDREPMDALIDQNGAILIAKKVELGGLQLKGIIYSPSMPLAIINDEVLSEGDVVAEWTIVTITEKTVTLEKDNKGFTLKLEEE